MSLVLRLFNRDASNEVAFQELIDGTGKPGYEKTRSCGEQVKRDGLQYFWVHMLHQQMKQHHPA